MPAPFIASQGNPLAIGFVQPNIPAIRDMMRVSKFLRPIARLYPIEMGKGWIAYLLKDQNIPDGDLVRTTEGVLLRTRPDYMFKHAYLFGEYEPVLTAVFKKLVQPGDVCFDVGASFGFYTCLFALRGARVFAFEPLPASFALNQDAVQLNGCGSRIKAYNAGLGERAGAIRVYTFKNLSLGHASSTDLGRADAIPNDCRITTIDDVCAEESLDQISFIKTDVEGFEYEVLKGGQKTLSKANAPIVHFEVNGQCLRHRNLDPNIIVSLLRGFGYTEFLQVRRYGGVRKAPPKLPVSDSNYLAFKDLSRLSQALS
jgi:FkbM family methyltransferase